jgi:hypothetical protein
MSQYFLLVPQNPQYLFLYTFHPAISPTQQRSTSVSLLSLTTFQWRTSRTYYAPPHVWLSVLNTSRLIANCAAKKPKFYYDSSGLTILNSPVARPTTASRERASSSHVRSVLTSISVISSKSCLCADSCPASVMASSVP